MMYQTIVPIMPTPTKKIKMVIKLEMCVTIVQKMQIQDSKILMEMVSGTNVRMTLIMMELLIQMTTAQKYLMLDKKMWMVMVMEMFVTIVLMILILARRMIIETKLAMLVKAALTQMVMEFLIPMIIAPIRQTLINEIQTRMGMVSMTLWTTAHLSQIQTNLIQIMMAKVMLVVLMMRIVTVFLTGRIIVLITVKFAPQTLEELSLLIYVLEAVINQNQSGNSVMTEKKSGKERIAVLVLPLVKHVFQQWTFREHYLLMLTQIMIALGLFSASKTPATSMLCILQKRTVISNLGK